MLDLICDRNIRINHFLVNTVLFSVLKRLGFRLQNRSLFKEEKETIGSNVNTDPGHAYIGRL